MPTRNVWKLWHRSRRRAFLEVRWKAGYADITCKRCLYVISKGATCGECSKQIGIV